MNINSAPIQRKCVKNLRVGNKIYKSAYDLELTEKDLEKAARELGETEEKKQECLRKLKKNLSKESDVKYLQDDAYLLRFLRVRKYDVNKTYQNVKSFTEVRKKHKHLFSLPSEMKAILQSNWDTILPYTDEEGRIMFWLNLDRWNPQERTLEEMVQAAFAMLDMVSINPTCQINGVIAIWNLDGMSMRHVSEVLWNGRLLILLSIIQNGYPWRIKKLIVLNTNAFVRFLYNLVKPLLRRKIAERIVLLGSDPNELHQHVNPILLPKSLNGSIEEEECDISQYVLDNLEYLRYERTFTS